MIAAFFVYRVSAKQQITSEFQINFALYQKRYAIYDVVISFIANISCTGTSSAVDRYEFLHATKEVKFLFGHDITSYVDLLINQADNLQTANVKMNYESDLNADKRSEIFNWFVKQLNECPNLFTSYLDFSKISLKDLN